MGEAKRRGTYEQRVEQAEAIVEAEFLELQRKRAERQAKLTVGVKALEHDVFVLASSAATQTKPQIAVRSRMVSGMGESLVQAEDR